MVVVVKTMQIKTPERLTRSVKYILNPKKTKKVEEICSSKIVIKEKIGE